MERVKRSFYSLGNCSFYFLGVLAYLGLLTFADTRNAIVTLVTGEKSGYAAGALALGQSLINVGSTLPRVILITPEVDKHTCDQLATKWNTIIHVAHIYCNYKIHNSVNKSEYDLKAERYIAGVNRWKSTCTKFAIFNLTSYDRIIFLDADTLVVAPIDDALYSFSNATLAAAPETFPPDTFNSGFMVVSPSEEVYRRVLEANERVGSAEGGDQGVLNNGLCPHWFNANTTDLHCGRLPWIFNVNAANFEKYNTLRKFSGLRLPAVIHFVSDGKPWIVLMYEYMDNSIQLISAATRAELAVQATQHILWRKAYFQATNDQNPRYSVLLQIVSEQQQKSTKDVSSSRKDVSSSSNTKSSDTAKEKKQRRRRRKEVQGARDEF